MACKEAISAEPPPPLELDLEQPEAAGAGRHEDPVGPGTDDLTGACLRWELALDGGAVYLQNRTSELPEGSGASARTSRSSSTAGRCHSRRH